MNPKWRHAVFALGLLRAVFNLLSQPVILYILLFKPRGIIDKLKKQEGRYKGDGNTIFIKVIKPNVIRRLLGDGFFERNITDIAKLESEVGTSILDIFDDHPIFAKYPHLRGLARNKEFERMQAEAKERQRKNNERQH